MAMSSLPSQSSTSRPPDAVGPAIAVNMPLPTGKRRTATHHPNTTSAPIVNSSSLSQPHPAVMPASSVPPHDTPSSSKSSGPFPIDDARSAVSRRRRFILYTLAFATMLALSSVLDVRRASLRNRHAKLQLTLPSSSSLSSLSDTGAASLISGTAGSADAASSAPNGRHHNTADSAGEGHSARPDSNAAQLPAQHRPNQRLHVEAQDRTPVASAGSASNASPPLAKALPPAHQSDGQTDANGSPSGIKRDVYLSQQELDDGVDQLIAHVEQEKSASAAASATNSTVMGAPVAPPVGAATGTTTAGAAAGGASVAVSDGTAGVEQDNATAGTTIGAGEDVRLNAEDYFNSAVKKLNELVKDEDFKRLVDENDLRTLQALELQATRGDCELKSGASGGLFKTDAEAASNVDIERTHPLWGAWCLFMDAYKTDAMHDYVKKQQVLEHKVIALKDAIAKGGNETALVGFGQDSGFDPSAASLDDVMTPEQQSALKTQTEMVVEHLQENDIRYLAALSFQATFGDCGPYGREVVREVKEAGIGSGDEKVEVRKLREPLLEQSVDRRLGALWGAWCVMQGKKRATAATELTERVKFLVDQLSKSQAEFQRDSPPEAAYSDAEVKAAAADGASDVNGSTAEGVA